MHLFAVTLDVPPKRLPAVRDALAIHAGEFGLDPATAWMASSDDDRVFAAGVHHTPERVAPRRYVHHRHRTATWFDGLPVARHGEFDARDASTLGRLWPQLHDLVDGQFCALRVDFEQASVEVLLDTFGLVPVYCARRDGGVLLSNSAWLVGHALGCDSPDPLGVSTFMGLGWAAADRTLADGVTALCGGARHRISRRGIDTERYFGPAQIARPEERDAAPTADELAREMVALTGRAVGGIDRVASALTGGRDSRVVLALLRAAGVDALYFTGGPDDLADVVIARELAERLGLRHEVVRHDPSESDRDWTAAAGRFVRQNDGLSSLLQLGDYVEASSTGPSIGVKLGGLAGEVGRSGTGPVIGAATNVPLVRSSVAAQYRLLALKARDPTGILTGEAHETIARHVGSFCADRLQEGWRPRELQEAFYIFERVGRWGQTGTRRVAATDDVFNPLCARVFVDYCLALTPAGRYLEAAHERLLSALDPVLREHRFEYRFHPQRHSYAPMHATASLAREVASTIAGRLRASAEQAHGTPARPEHAFPHEWLEERLQLVRELFDQPASELWNVVSRQRIGALLEGSEHERARHQAHLLRAATLFWHFHGPAAPDVAAPLTFRRLASAELRASRVPQPSGYRPAALLEQS